MIRLLISSLLMIVALNVVGTFYAATPLYYQERVSTPGAIRGHVLDAQGKPVAGVRVVAGFTSGLVPSAKTDDNGGFLIEGLKPGTYMLTVSKEEDGYPNTISSFYFGLAVLPHVTVYAGQVTSGVTIWLGPKAAKLVGLIVDATTNQPIEKAQILLRHTDNPNNSYLTGPNQMGVKGGFKILAPSVPFTMKVSASGYEDWYYKKDNSPNRADAIRLAPDTTMELTIHLKTKSNRQSRK